MATIVALSSISYCTLTQCATLFQFRSGPFLVFKRRIYSVLILSTYLQTYWVLHAKLKLTVPRCVADGFAAAATWSALQRTADRSILTLHDNRIEALIQFEYLNTN